MANWASILRAKNVNPFVSFKSLRRLIGVLGMLLPAICFLGGFLIMGLGLGPSISSYYYTNVRDVFVGILACVGLFMLTYTGYELIDNIVAKLTGLCALGIAIFPCFNAASGRVGFFNLGRAASNAVHTLSAGLFFLLLAINSIFLFTLTDGTGNVTRNKKIRNAIYVGCGVIILACLGVIALLHLFFTQDQLDATVWIFILESVLLEAFGVSWLVKGETIFRD